MVDNLSLARSLRPEIILFIPIISEWQASDVMMASYIYLSSFAYLYWHALAALGEAFGVFGFFTVFSDLVTLPRVLRRIFVES